MTGWIITILDILDICVFDMSRKRINPRDQIPDDVFEQYKDNPEELTKLITDFSVLRRGAKKSKATTSHQASTKSPEQQEVPHTSSCDVVDSPHKLVSRALWRKRASDFFDQQEAEQPKASDTTRHVSTPTTGPLSVPVHHSSDGKNSDDTQPLPSVSSPSRRTPEPSSEEESLQDEDMQLGDAIPIIKKRTRQQSTDSVGNAIDSSQLAVPFKRRRLDADTKDNSNTQSVAGKLSTSTKRRKEITKITAAQLDEWFPVPPKNTSISTRSDATSSSRVETSVATNAKGSGFGGRPTVSDIRRLQDAEAALRAQMAQDKREADAKTANLLAEQKAFYLR
jgi:hypothetical protein